MFKKLNRIRFFQVLIYLAARYIITCLSIVGSFDKVQYIGRILGLILYFLDKRHRDIALENIKSSSLLLNHHQAQQMVQKVYEHFGMTFAEIAIAQTLTRKKRLLNHVIFGGLDNVNNTLSKGRGAIVVLGHLGNWDLAGIAFSQLGYNIVSVVRPLDNPYLDRYLSRSRQISGQIIIEKWDAFKHVQQSLKNNKLVAILVDQDARMDGIFVDFFGRKASTTKSAALLSLRCNVPIIPTNIFRDGSIIRVIFTTPIYPEPSDVKIELKRLTQKYTDKIEDFIRQHPDQWLWLHRRWKTQPEAT